MTHIYSRVHDDILISDVGNGKHIIRVESEDWWDWLRYKEPGEFIYTSRWGNFIARRATSQDHCFWSAIYAHEGNSAKRHLGEYMELTAGRLRRSAALLKKIVPVSYPSLSFSFHDQHFELTNRRDRTDDQQSPPPLEEKKPSTCSLSKREIEIVEHIMAGRSNGEIAKAMYLAESTVRWYLQNIYLKLHIHNRVQLALMAKELILL